MLPIVNELGRTRLEVNVKLKANFSAKLFALNLLVTVPVPENTARADIHTTLGTWPPDSGNALLTVSFTKCSDAVTAEKAYVMQST